MPPEIVFVSMLRALIEVAGLMFLLRGILWLIGPKARRGNFVYDILTVGATPFMRLTRAATPRLVRDTYVPLLAFIVLVLLWIALGFGQHVLCNWRGVQCF
jgi:hypothetical protein